MTVVILDNSDLSVIASARAVAGDLEPSLRYIRDRAQKTLDGVNVATTIEKVLLRYAKCLGAYHASAIQLTYSMHRHNADYSLLQHIEAADQIQRSITTIEMLISQPAIWIAVPNLQNTRFNIISVLTRTIRAIDQALESCAVLRGHQPAEESAA